MKIKVSDIPEEGLSVIDKTRVEIDGQNLPVDMDLRIDKQGTEVLVNGSVSAEIEMVCNRCLAEFKKRIDVPVSLVYEPAEEVKGQTHELGMDELDTGFYREDELDLDAVVTEQVVLNMPIQSLCSENCKGICPHCGANLNEGSCSCPAEQKPGLGIRITGKEFN